MKLHDLSVSVADSNGFASIDRYPLITLINSRFQLDYVTPAGTVPYLLLAQAPTSG